MFRIAVLLLSVLFSCTAEEQRGSLETSINNRMTPLCKCTGASIFFIFFKKRILFWAKWMRGFLCQHQNAVQLTCCELVGSLERSCCSCVSIIKFTHSPPFFSFSLLPFFLLFLDCSEPCPNISAVDRQSCAASCAACSAGPYFCDQWAYGEGKKKKKESRGRKAEKKQKNMKITYL